MSELRVFTPPKRVYHGRFTCDRHDGADIWLTGADGFERLFEQKQFDAIGFTPVPGMAFDLTWESRPLPRAPDEEQYWEQVVTGVSNVETAGR